MNACQLHQDPDTRGILRQFLLSRIFPVLQTVNLSSPLFLLLPYLKCHLPAIVYRILLYPLALVLRMWKILDIHARTLLRWWSMPSLYDAGNIVIFNLLSEIVFISSLLFSKESHLFYRNNRPNLHQVLNSKLRLDLSLSTQTLLSHRIKRNWLCQSNGHKRCPSISLLVSRPLCLLFLLILLH